MIDVDAASNRVMSWVNYLLDVEGELYWGMNAADGLYYDGSWENQLAAGGNHSLLLTSTGAVFALGTALPTHPPHTSATAPTHPPVRH